MSLGRNNTNNFLLKKFYSQNLGFAIYRGLLDKLLKLGNTPLHYAQHNALARDVYQEQNLAQALQVAFVSQGPCPDDYVQNVVDYKKVNTRTDSWHDLFNNLTWLFWPRTKWALTNRIFLDGQGNSTNRTPIQSFLAQFDECGVLIVTSKKNIIDNILEHQWYRLFVEHRAQHQQLLPLIFGHGLLEKMMTPFCGITGKSILVRVRPKFFTLPKNIQYRFLDELIANYIASKACSRSAKTLQPFPILGMPNWYESNQEPSFCLNTEYFRPKRNGSIKCVVLNNCEDKSLWGQWKWLAPDD